MLHISEEGKAFDVGPDQTLLLWPGRRHVGTKPNPLHLLYYWVYFSVHEVPGNSEDLLLHVPQHTTVGRPDHMLALLHRILDDRDLGAYEGRTADLALMLALSEIALDPEHHTTSESTASVAYRADAIIRSNFHTEISTGALAEQLECSAGYLSRAYRNAYGISVVEAIHRRRIQHAQHLLMMGELDIEDIARDCGFQDSGYFRRIFNRHTGMTPRHYQSLNIRAELETPESEG